MCRDLLLLAIVVSSSYASARSRLRQCSSYGGLAYLAKIIAYDMSGHGDEVIPYGEN